MGIGRDSAEMEEDDDLCALDEEEDGEENGILCGLDDDEDMSERKCSKVGFNSFFVLLQIKKKNSTNLLRNLD